MGPSVIGLTSSTDTDCPGCFGARQLRRPRACGKHRARLGQSIQSVLVAQAGKVGIALPVSQSLLDGSLAFAATASSTMPSEFGGRSSGMAEGVGATGAALNGGVGTAWESGFGFMGGPMVRMQSFASFSPLPLGRGEKNARRPNLCGHSIVGCATAPHGPAVVAWVAGLDTEQTAGTRGGVDPTAHHRRLEDHRLVQGIPPEHFARLGR